MSLNSARPSREGSFKVRERSVETGIGIGILLMLNLHLVHQELSRLVGKPIWDTWRLLNIQIFDFGRRISRLNKRGETIDHGEFTLRITCAWRLCREDGILVGHSDRDWEDEQAPERFDHWTMLDAKAQSWCDQAGDNPRIVVEVRAERFGGATLCFSDSSTLEIFPTSSEWGESWRLLYPVGDRERHFIVDSCKIEYTFTGE